MQNAVLELYAPTVHTELQNLHLRCHQSCLQLACFITYLYLLYLPAVLLGWTVSPSLFFSRNPNHREMMSKLVTATWSPHRGNDVHWLPAMTFAANHCKAVKCIILHCIAFFHMHNCNFQRTTTRD